LGVRIGVQPRLVVDQHGRARGRGGHLDARRWIGNLSAIERPKEHAAEARIAQRRPLLLGIRPTDLVVGAARELQLAGTVFLVEPVGPVTYVDVDLGGPTVKATCDPDAAPAAGDRVMLGFSAGRVRLFDPTSEDRL